MATNPPFISWVTPDCSIARMQIIVVRQVKAILCFYQRMRGNGARPYFTSAPIFWIRPRVWGSGAPCAGWPAFWPALCTGWMARPAFVRVYRISHIAYRCELRAPQLTSKIGRAPSQFSSRNFGLSEGQCLSSGQSSPWTDPIDGHTSCWWKRALTLDAESTSSYLTFHTIRQASWIFSKAHFPSRTEAMKHLLPAKYPLRSPSSEPDILT